MGNEIILIRHGKTAGNLRGAYIGRTDESLCPEGRALLLARKGLTWTGEAGPEDGPAYREAQYDKLAAALRAGLDMEAVYRILERGLD